MMSRGEKVNQLIARCLVEAEADTCVREYVNIIKYLVCNKKTKVISRALYVDFSQNCFLIL